MEEEEEEEAAVMAASRAALLCRAGMTRAPSPVQVREEREG